MLMINFHFYIFKAIYNLELAIEVEILIFKYAYEHVTSNIRSRDLLFDNLHCIGMYNVFFTTFTKKRNNTYKQI